MRPGIRFGSLLASIAVVCSASSNVRGTVEQYAVAELKEMAPDSLSPEVRGVMNKTGYRVTNSADKVICDVWLRAELPVMDKFKPQNDVNYGMEPGTLIGAIRFSLPSSDYRKQSIKPGTYTLRYGHQPQDGNHIGTAQNRDFAVAVPAADDRSAAGMSQEKAMDMSKKASGTTHPAIFSLLPPQNVRAKIPTMAHDEALELEVLVAKTSAKPGGSAKEIQIELVTVGHAPE